MTGQWDLIYAPFTRQCSQMKTVKFFFYRFVCPSTRQRRFGSPKQYFLKTGTRVGKSVNAVSALSHHCYVDSENDNVVKTMTSSHCTLLNFFVERVWKTVLWRFERAAKKQLQQFVSFVHWKKNIDTAKLFKLETKKTEPTIVQANQNCQSAWNILYTCNVKHVGCYVMWVSAGWCLQFGW